MQKEVLQERNNIFIRVGLTALILFSLVAFTQSAGGDRFHDFAENPDVCAGCHTAHRGDRGGLIREKGVHKTCLACHDGTRGPGKPYYNDDYQRHYWSLSEEVTRDGTVYEIYHDYSCNVCHLLHGTFVEGEGGEKIASPPKTPWLRESFDTAGYGNYEVCLHCHRADGYMQVEGETVYEASDIEQYYSGIPGGTNAGHFLRNPEGTEAADGEPYQEYWKLACNACHGYHGTTNLKQLDPTKYLHQSGADAWKTQDSLQVEDGFLTSGSMRVFCGACHDTGGVEVFGKEFFLSGDVTAHGEGDTGCFQCHGQEGEPLSAAHAPRVPEPDSLTVVVVDGGSANEKEITAWLNYTEDSVKRKVRHISREIKFDGPGTFIVGGEDKSGPVYVYTDSNGDAVVVFRTENNTSITVSYGTIEETVDIIVQ
jgi:predicted CXXCH cytochrome family protein